MKPLSPLEAVLLVMLMAGCETGVDKNAPAGDPAVGRNFNNQEAPTNDSARNAEASQPIRNIAADTAATGTARR